MNTNERVIEYLLDKLLNAEQQIVTNNAEKTRVISNIQAKCNEDKNQYAQTATLFKRGLNLIVDMLGLDIVFDAKGRTWTVKGELLSNEIILDDDYPFLDELLLSWKNK